MLFINTETKSVRWLLAELTVVILGILIAFQIEDFRSNRSDRLQESTNLELIIIDLDAEKTALVEFLNLARSQVEGLRSIESYIREPGRINNADLETAFRSATLTSLADPISSTYDSMRSNDTIDLVSEPELLLEITDYYDSWSTYISSVVSNMRDARDSFIEAIGSDIYYIPRDELGVEDASSIEIVIREPVEEIPRDPRFYGALSSYAFRITFLISRLEIWLELNTKLRSDIEQYLKSI